MDSTQGMVYLQDVLVQGVSVTCPVLAIEYLTKNVAHNPSTGLFISLYHLNAVFSLNLLLPFGVGVFKQMKIKHGRFQYSLELPPGTILFFCHVFVLLTYFSNPQAPTLVSGIFVEAGL